MHPYTSAPRTPANAASTLIALDVALGLGDYYDIGALYSDERGSADFYYRLLNAGFRIPATGGTDNFSDVWLDPPPGSDRDVRARHGSAQLARTGWTPSSAAARSSRPARSSCCRSRAASRATRLALATDGARRRMRVKADVVSIAPLDSLEILVNGDIVADRARRPIRCTSPSTVRLPCRGRLGRRARERSRSRQYLGDDYAFAQTTPVYVVRGGRRFIKASDVQFLADTVDAIWTRVEKSPLALRRRARRRSARPSIARRRSIRSSVARKLGSR